VGGFAACLLFTGAALAAQPEDFSELATPGHELIARANEVFGVSEGRLLDFDAAKLRGGPLRTKVPIGGAEYTVELSPVSVRAKNYQLFVQAEDGSLLPATPHPVRTFQGRLIELPGSRVAASLSDDGLQAIIIFPNESTYAVEPLARRVGGASPRQHIVYPKESIAPRGSCGTPDAPRPWSEGPPGSPDGVATGTVLLAELAIDSDVEYYQDYGSIAATEAQIHSIVNTMNIQYERDIGVRHIITALIVRPTEPDPYTTTSAGSLLNHFRDVWNAYYDHIPRDAAQLFTGKDLNDLTIGMAYTYSVCFEDASYSVVESNATACSSFACKTDLSAHELGHIWGGNHCSCPGWTMNSVIQSANRFHPEYDIPDIIALRDSRACFDVGDVCDGTGTIDCNENGVADPCDLSTGTSPDADGNNTPDECQPPPEPLAEPFAEYRNRVLAFMVPTAETLAPGALTALRLRMLELGGWQVDFGSYESGPSCADPLNCTRWVGKPQPVLEHQGRPQDGTFVVARLQCTPYYHDWTAEGYFHVVGADILPNSAYELENLSERCAGEEDTCQLVSAASWIGTGKFGDVVAPFDPPAEEQPNAIDVTSIVNKFRALPGAPSRIWTQLQPNVPDWNADINALDVVAGVDAFRGFAYPYSGPCPCPSAVTCNTVACTTSSSCNNSGLCIRACNGGDDAGQPCNNNSHCRNGACGPGFCRDRCGRCN
jgi:hypothetical protein